MRRDRGNGRRRAAVVLAAALGVSACAAAVEAPTPETAPEPAAEVSEPEAEIAVAPEPLPEPAPEPAAAEPAASAPAEPPPEPAPEPVEETVARLAPPPEIDDDPEQVIGLDPGALEALLGAPGFVREDADAQVWQYRGAGCVLDAFLYSDGLAEPYRVTYYEIRGDAGTDGAKRRCFRSLLPQRERG